MKKTKFILGVVAALSMVVAMTGCDLTIRDPYTPPEVDGITVGLGGENTFNVTKVSINGTADASLVNSSFAPSGWNKINEFIQADIAAGEYVEYTFTQPTAGTSNWSTWSIAVFDANNYGNFLRGDNWLNLSSDAGFAAGKWNNGGVTAGGTYSNGYTFETAGHSLDTAAVVVIKVAFDGDNVTITETVNGDLAYSTSSANW